MTFWRRPSWHPLVCLSFHSCHLAYGILHWLTSVLWMRFSITWISALPIWMTFWFLQSLSKSTSRTCGLCLNISKNMEYSQILPNASVVHKKSHSWDTRSLLKDRTHWTTELRICKLTHRPRQFTNYTGSSEWSTSTDVSYVALQLSRPHFTQFCQVLRLRVPIHHMNSRT